MNNIFKQLTFLMIVVCAISQSSHAVLIKDIVRIKGGESSVILGQGLVTGLNGTGDSKLSPTARVLSQQVARLIDETVVSTELLASKNVALVQLSAVIPESGIAEGDKINVKVSSFGNAKSLEGGQLTLTPLAGPYKDSPVYAMASGTIHLNNPNIPTTGIIYNGADMIKSIYTQYLNEQGYITLVLDNKHAYINVASNLANQINEKMQPDGPRIAFALGAKNIIVSVPKYHRDDPAQFISDILMTYVDPVFVKGRAHVYINSNTGTIIIEGNVQISPAGISQPGLKITRYDPEPKPTEFQPKITQNNWAILDPENRGGPRLVELTDAFEQLQVPVKDRIDIIKALHASGNIHAELIID